MKRISLLLALIGAILCGVAPAHALLPTPAWRSVLLAVPQQTPTVQIDVSKKIYARRGVNYGSFSAIPGASFSRNSAGYATNATRGNWVPNSAMAGAVAGSPGTQPSGWSANPGGGMTWQVSNVVQQGGFICADEHLYGTSTNTNPSQIYLVAGSSAPSFPGQQWTFSAYTQLVAGSSANLSSPGINVGELNNGTYIGSTSAGAAVSLGAQLSRISVTKTVANPSANGVEVYVNFGPTGTGLPIDVTFRLCAPQLEHGPTANGFLATSGSVVTVNDPNGYDLGLTYFPTRTNKLFPSVVPGTPPGGTELWNPHYSVGPNTYTANALSAPDGSITATKVVTSANTYDGPYWRTAANLPAPNSVWTFSDWVYSTTPQTIRLAVGQTGGTAWSGSGTYTTDCALAANAWTRCSVSATAAASITATSVTYAVLAASPSSTFYTWGAMLEPQSTPAPAGGYPTAYISTTSAAVSVNDFRCTDLGCLIEQASTNLLSYSQSAFATQWADTNVTSADAATTAPDGTTTASSLTDNTTNGAHQVTSPSVSFTSGNTYTYSIFAKAGTLRYLQLSFPNSVNSGSGYANFDLQAGTVAGSGGTGITSGVQVLANGWDRCWITTTANGTASGTTAFWLQNSASAPRAATYAGTGQTLYVWGAQIEQVGLATSYTPTTTASATRAADVAVITGLPGSLGITLYTKVYPTQTGSANAYLAALTDGGTGNRVDIFRSGGGTGVGTRWSVGGTTYDTAGPGTQLTYGTSAKIAITGPSNIRIGFNGAVTTVGASAPTTRAMTILNVGINETASIQQLNDYLQAVAVYPYQMTPTQLQALTH